MTPFTLPESLLQSPISATPALAGASTFGAALGDEPTIVVFVRHLG